MSKGHGAVQRAALAELHRYAVVSQRYGDGSDWISVSGLANLVFDADDQPTRTQVESVRRACRKLAAEGLVDAGRCDLNGATHAAVRLLADSLRTSEAPSE